MPTIEGLRFRYALYVMPPGRLPFRRWKWELWHGPTLVASGWRVTRRDAGRALRTHAARFGHRLFGLPEPDGQFAGDVLPGSSVRLTVGPFSCELVPRALESPVV